MAPIGKRKHSKLFRERDPVHGWLAVISSPNAWAQSYAVTVLIEYLKPRVPALVSIPKRARISEPADHLPQPAEEETPHEKSSGSKATSVAIFDTGCQQVLALGLPAEVDPVELARELLLDPTLTAEAGRVAKTVLRILPIQRFCESSVDALEVTLRDLVAAAFPVEPPPGTRYSVEIKRRNNEGFGRDAINAAVCRQMPRGMVATYRDPHYRVLVEVIKSACGVSVLSASTPWGTFNLRARPGPEGAAGAAGATGGATGSASAAAPSPVVPATAHAAAPL